MTTKKRTEQLRELVDRLGATPCPVEIVIRNTGSRHGVRCWTGGVYVEGHEIAGADVLVGESVERWLTRLLEEAWDTIQSERIEEQYQ